MGLTSVAALVACAPQNEISIPQAPLEECVYSSSETVFSVWSPMAQEAQVKLYATASDSVAFKIVRMRKSKDGLW